jgi:hypothetical protein
MSIVLYNSISILLTFKVTDVFPTSNISLHCIPSSIFPVEANAIASSVCYPITLTFTSPSSITPPMPPTTSAPKTK